MSDSALPQARIGLPLVFASIAGLWLCYFSLVTMRSWLLDWEGGWDLFWRRGVVSLAGMALTVVLWWALSRFDRCATWAKIAAALVLSLPVSMASAQVNYTVFHPLDEALGHTKKTVVVKVRRESGDDVLGDPGGARPEDRTVATEIVLGQPLDEEPPPATVPLPGLGEFELASWEYATDMAFGRYFMLLSWCALYLAMSAGARARIAERREGEYRRAAANAEVRSLRYQVNPHFLFNTFNSLSALVMTGRPERAEEMIQTLSTYYRRTLSSDPTADSTLADEIALQQLYLEIETVRFPDRVRTQVEISPIVANAQVPGMILQPIVENSVKYAIAARHEPVTIGIRAAEVGGKLVVTVQDDGPMTETGDPHGCGIGLGNVRDRLRARYGSEASLAFGPREDGGFETVLTMPLERKRG